MDIEVKRMSPAALEMLDQFSAVCKRFGVDYYATFQNQRDLLDSIALHEYQLKKAHEQGLKRSEVLPFLGLKVRVLCTMRHKKIRCQMTTDFLFICILPPGGKDGTIK